MDNLIQVEYENGDPKLSKETFNTVCAKIMKISTHPGEIEEQLSEIPALYSYYYGIMIRAKRILDYAEDDLEKHKALSRTEKRKEVKLTAIAGEDFVNSLPETVALNNEVFRLREVYGYAKGICGSLEMKKEMLVQLSANSRQESKLYQ